MDIEKIKLLFDIIKAKLLIFIAIAGGVWIYGIKSGNKIIFFLSVVIFSFCIFGILNNTKSQNSSYIHLFLALTKYAQQECKFFNTSKKLKSANASALRVKCTFFNAFSPLKFAIVSLYLVSTFLLKNKCLIYFGDWYNLLKLGKIEKEIKNEL